MVDVIPVKKLPAALSEFEPGDQIARQFLLNAPTALKNRLINGNFQVNQRGVSGTVVLTAGQYGHDRWKAGASGCTYTFASSGGIVTLTITAGSLQQVILGDNLQSGIHTLSWGGTAQGKIGAGSYASSGVTASVTGGVNLTIEFSTGTLFAPQLEPGAEATLFEYRPVNMELDTCRWYYTRQLFPNGAMASSSTAQLYCPLPAMRVTPTVSAVPGPNVPIAITGLGSATLSSVIIGVPNSKGFGVFGNSSVSSTLGNPVRSDGEFQASAEL
ncbi:hypothetical protein PQS90_08870 [Pseudomonas sp. BLCC-B13]|uniref:hypothetical protein n=1 Tax=Pseudomonas sp. BLCC-B13 TaxID=3025314 RepID=UPI00234EF0D4|nr:hypothetical protein [Pseudomonas sp. BLCC-B13]MDC7825261.1 hypothetical protein [Pseudomonas sp. BLCC-B13]